MKFYFFLVFVFAMCNIGQGHAQGFPNTPMVRENVPLDSIRLSDPFIFPDTDSKTYYMTGTGGMLWKSKDLALWSGPYKPYVVDPDSWMGPRPMVWAAEIHKYNGKYYFFATFTNLEVNIDTVEYNVIPRRACHVLVSDKPEGPYVSINKNTCYLPADKPTLDATLWIDNDSLPYMVYCHEWLQNRNGTVEKIRLKDDFSNTIGEPTIMFRANESPWSRETTEDGKIKPNMVTDGPFLFKTTNGRLGIIWTSWIGDVYTQGVAYSLSSTLDGPWIQEPDPITPPNFGHGMIFNTFDGRTLMAVHSHLRVGQERVIRIPHLFTVSLKGNNMKVLQEYKP